MPVLLIGTSLGNCGPSTRACMIQHKMLYYSVLPDLRHFSDEFSAAISHAHSECPTISNRRLLVEKQDIVQVCLTQKVSLRSETERLGFKIESG